MHVPRWRMAQQKDQPRKINHLHAARGSHFFPACLRDFLAEINFALLKLATMAKAVKMELTEGQTVVKEAWKERLENQAEVVQPQERLVVGVLVCCSRHIFSSRKLVSYLSRKNETALPLWRLDLYSRLLVQMAP